MSQHIEIESVVGALDASYMHCDNQLQNAERVGDGETVTAYLIATSVISHTAEALGLETELDLEITLRKAA